MIVDVVRHASAEDLAEATAARIVTTVVEALSAQDEVHLCLTGGGIGTAVLGRLRASADAVDWSRVHLWWGDERFLAAGDPERNETGARAALIDHIPIPPAHVHAMPTPQQSGDDVDRAATLYADQLATYAGPHDDVPSMDVVLLGIGPDGHVASLFPELPAVHDRRAAVGVHGSPKPPPLRVTLTLRTIQAAQQVWVLAAGESKARAVALALMPEAGEFQIPAAGARGRRRTLFLVDEAAAGDLPDDLGRPGA